MMLTSMRQASLGDGLFDSDAGGGFRDMQDAASADAVAQHGLLGFARQMEALVK